MNARALTAWWRVMCRTRNRKTLSVFERKRGRAAGEQWGFCDSTDPAWPEVNVTLMWRKRKWASFLQLHQHFISNNAIKQTAPGSRAELKKIPFFFFFFHPIYLFFHMRPRYSNFNQIVACYLCSCPNLIPGKVTKKRLWARWKSFSAQSAFFYLIWCFLPHYCKVKCHI